MSKKVMQSQITLPSIQQKRIQHFLNTNLRDTGRYIIESRACPRLSDGLRIGARKIVYAGMTGDLRKVKKDKTMSLVGDVLKLGYKHGDASLVSTMMMLSSGHINRHKVFDIIGQTGYIRETKCKVAPRYLSISKSPNMQMFEVDKELWDIQIEEGKKTEPVSLFPIVPTVLMYRTSSPGFGISYRSFSYTLDSIIDNCIASIMTGTCTDKNITLRPTVEGVKDENFVYNHSTESWYSIGEVEFNFDNDTVAVNDLPFNVQHSEYEEHLQSLIDKGVIIKYQNLSQDQGTRFLIKFSYGRLRTIYNSDKWTIFKMLKLYSKVSKDIFNCVMDNGSIQHFDDAYQVVDAFVQQRLKIYDKRKENTTADIRNKISELEMKIKFIKLVVDGTIKINNVSLVDVRRQLDEYDINHDVVKIPIYKLTKEEILSMESEIVELKNELEYILNTTIQDMYISELIELKNKFATPCLIS